MRSFKTCTLPQMYVIRLIISRRMKWTGVVAHMGMNINTDRILVELKGKRPLERPIHRFEDNIKMDFR
jgi:hypothetical protein